ncbi:hypothetical protein LAZ67_12002207 [Cordylochernes scorpioides]|uniref:Uncharacterized protein n=1 Tax=Cordylochernes scorpioides TaxID=51811 RepID=A0ABY6L3I9_9ARAC|nr:hypothetical protein LAZ67_12002207 [Cordylochernes scorpioides]
MSNMSKYSRNNTKEPFIPHETGNYPFKKIRQEKQWSPAKVIAPGVHPRSYLLEDTKGSVLRRNRRDLPPAGTLSGPTEKESPPEKQEQLDPQPFTSSQSEETSATARTKCGRLVKPPVRLNL